MKKLVDFEDDTKFYYGTIIVLKDVFLSPTGSFDIKYCMILDGASSFKMLDLYKSIGHCMVLDLPTNIENHAAVNKKAIKDWVTLYFNSFYTEEGQQKWIPLIDDILYIEQLTDYFKQANRNLFMS